VSDEHLCRLKSKLGRMLGIDIRREEYVYGTLAVQLTLPLAGCVEDLHLQVSAPCRAHQRKRSLLVSKLLKRKYEDYAAFTFLAVLGWGLETGFFAI
jgi:hypothetical protein